MFETIIDNDFLKNELGYSDALDTITQKFKRQDAYLEICGFVTEKMFARPTIDNIEDYINDGYYEYTDCNGYTGQIVCPITDATDRIYLWKIAIGKQYIADIETGRIAETTDGGFKVCDDVIPKLKTLGLLRQSFQSVL